MKNKMEIHEDPKFLITNYQGILTLNIRRPSPFDAGTYSCRAFNELGEALAECKLDVRGEEGMVPHWLTSSRALGKPTQMAQAGRGDGPCKGLGLESISVSPRFPSSSVKSPPVLCPESELR